ncbi:MAG TPA: hypothetical protein VGV61_03730 [Thermoanaerobaculia bacterium]|jgi:hypothetical protein|nr:hypothetical protein [Thermoanaerobaculia bacterium]
MSQPLPRPSSHDTLALEAGPTSANADAAVAAAAEVLARLARRWNRRRQHAAALAGLGVGLTLAVAAYRLAPPASWLPVAAGLLLPVVAALLLARPGRATSSALGEHLDRRLPPLAESSGLLLVEPEASLPGRPSPPATLSPLQRLQRRRTALALLAMDERALVRLLPWRPLHRGLAVLLAGGASAALLLALPAPRSPAARARAAGAARSPAHATPTPWLRALTVTIEPPAYTGRPSRVARTLDVAVEEGARVRWRVEVAPAVRTVALLLDESLPVPLRAAGPRVFTAVETVRAPRLVRLVLLGARDVLWRSPPARLELLADRAPTLELLAPKATPVERPAARPGALAVTIALADDYGVAGAEVVSTLASGSGEQVAFAERRLPLAVRPTPARQVVYATIDLATYGLAAESELYLRVEVRDRRLPAPNVARSPTIVVRPAGTRQESAALGAGIPVLVAPELFRSQRQILIDTEQLIAAQPRLSAAEALRRSRAIGFDQRALRMRYGTLLGQELEEGRPTGPEDELGGREAGPPGVPGGLVHEHDSAESATFFADPVRRRLRAMLAAMWDAEGTLATGVPRTALPHERTALRLLKEVQQADRVYVPKTAGEGAPLDPSRRLGGELRGVHDLAPRAPERAASPVVAAALALLAALDGGATPLTTTARDGVLAPAALAILRPALAARARAGSAAALAALPALDDVATATAAQRQALTRGLWELVPPPQAPTRSTAPAGSLWKRYRERLGAAAPPGGGG